MAVLTSNTPLCPLWSEHIVAIKLEYRGVYHPMRCFPCRRFSYSCCVQWRILSSSLGGCNLCGNFRIHSSAYFGAWFPRVSNQVGFRHVIVWTESQSVPTQYRSCNTHPCQICHLDAAWHGSLVPLPSSTSTTWTSTTSVRYFCSYCSWSLHLSLIQCWLLTGEGRLTSLPSPS